MDPTTLAATAIGGTALNAYGQSRTASANASANEYNSQIALNNAMIAEQQAKWAGQEGTQEVERQSLKNRAESAGIKANQAASGIDVNSGSAVDTQQSARLLGNLDAMTIRSNAIRSAYGYQVQAENSKAQSKLNEFAADNDIEAGNINTGSTLLGGTADTYFKYLNSKSMF